MNHFLNEYHELLHSCNKPYQYVGGEFLSRNKSFQDAQVTFAFAFPDKYEIGISNLGQRILYGLVNDHTDFMADRVYAPEVDFKDALSESERVGRAFYSLESKTPLKNFDIIGFSLQYELSYPTVLAMLDMAGVNIKSNQRFENEPIILAGGPCVYNPLPLADFIDAFLIGDGEDVILEVCETIQCAKAQGLSRTEKIKKLSEIKGVFVPKYPQKVKKRIVQIDYGNALKAYPIPFSSSVHDRAIVEIRRGCGRMCRFCQPGHVNLPVRERSAQDIIKIAKELVQNTGYDEYSLLSLSSNDYSNIKEVIKELAVDFDEKKISVSLPSQRIDGFNLELANLVQSVRKSTMTLAPEAGSQRLRDVIRKNITEEQILDAVLTLYENGWSKIKFYFIVGLPTETPADIDEMINLFEKIKYQTKEIKREKGLKHSLEITCTLSIFVPKPFTPFQWAGQADLNEITTRIHYLKDKTKHIKGLKINYHDKFVSQIEAVLTRGDARLCDYIEKLWQKGCYLDAWSEHFDKNVWRETAEELGISLEELARKEFLLQETLPWEFIDIGVKKDWLINEYEQALSCRASMPDLPYQYNNQPSCETGCVDCGVCKSFKTKKVMDVLYERKMQRGKDAKTHSVYNNYASMHPGIFASENIPSTKYRLKVTKNGILRYFSHLDWQNTFLKALARSGLNIAFSQGFNPSMKVSLGIALPLFVESECELVDIELIEEEKPVISLTGKELGDFDNEKDIRKAAIDYYKKNIQGKTIEHPALGEIQFTNTGIKKTKSTSGDIRKLQVFPKLLEILEESNLEGIRFPYKTNSKFNKYYYLINNVYLNGVSFGIRITIGEDINGKKYYNLNDIKYDPPKLTDRLIPGNSESYYIITDYGNNFNPNEDTQIKTLQLKLEKVLPEGCKILDIKKLNKEAKAIDHTVQWAEYEIKLFDNTLHNFECLRYNMSKVLSSDEILLTKKNKKGILKTTNIKQCVKSYDFMGESLFIVLKTGQAGVLQDAVPALRADDLMQIIAPDILFNIKRVRFFDENLKEL